MGGLAVIGGHGILETEFASRASRVESTTPYGRVAAFDVGPYVVVQRHGLDDFVSAPFVDHRANLWAVADFGCDRVLGLGSVGGLRRDLPVGAVLAPDDFIALQLRLSFSRGREGHQAPGFDAPWRRVVLDTWAQRSDEPVRDGGVYWQTTGPRFETPAEIRLIAAHADVVGMTIASECVLAGELGLAYAAVCMVDNLANGIGDAPLTIDEFHTGAARNRARLVAMLERVLPQLAEMPR